MKFSHKVFDLAADRAARCQTKGSRRWLQFWLMIAALMVPAAGFGLPLVVGHFIPAIRDEAATVAAIFGVAGFIFGGLLATAADVAREVTDDRRD